MLKYLFVMLLMSLPAFADVSVPRAKSYAWTSYDVSRDGGGSVSHATGLTLAGGSIVTDVWLYINTAFTDSGTGSFGIQCAGTLDIMGYTDITALSKYDLVGRHLGPTAFGSGNIISSGALGAIPMSVQNGSIPSDCAVTVVVRGDSGFVPLTAGVATLVLEYFKLQ